MHYFENESETTTVGDLLIENRVDRVTLSGSIDLTLDQDGLALTRTLIEHLGAIEKAMIEKRNSGTLPKKVQTTEPKAAGAVFGMTDPKAS
jgi:hypothetical protein